MSNVMVKVTRSTIVVPMKKSFKRNVHMKYESPTSSGKEAMIMERSCHMECTYIIYTFGIHGKVM